VYGVAPACNDRDVQALTNEAKDLLAPLAVVLADVIYDEGGIPIDLRHELERQTARFDVPGILGGIERDFQLIYRYSIKLTRSSASAVAAIP
jgi:hypothetical protein